MSAYKCLKVKLILSKNYFQHFFFVLETFYTHKEEKYKRIKLVEIISTQIYLKQQHLHFSAIDEN